jgi:hypothetical protein
VIVFHPGVARRCIFASVLGLFLLAVIPASSQNPARYQWPALSKVLKENSVPLPPSDVADPAMTINSFGVINEPSQFAIAFYRDNGNDELKPPLYLLRYDKSAQRWIHKELSGVQAMFTTGLAPDGKPLSAECLGSASIESIPGFVLVNTHLTPSASCLMVLTPKLHLTKTLSGWNIATIGSTLIYERSERHFAPTHPLRIAAYDLKTSREFDIFPPARDALREDFQRRLAAAISDGSCQGENTTCNAANFGSDLDDRKVSDDQTAIAFKVNFSSNGYGPEADADIGGETYFYVFKLAPKLDYRAFDEFDMKPKFGEATADVLVRSDVLRRIFPANK